MADQDNPKPDPLTGSKPADATRIDAPALPGRIERIGNYHIRRLIGSGGMGEVYEAMQEHPRRIVALKVMRPGMASASALRRFEYESQVLARLQHPGIAQIFEAGTHRDAGLPEPVPYFAMEYIALATPITEFAKERGLTARQRLELMSRVCDAVAYGHSKGIIHRDLKPSNILVDADGNPKIIDFGVARGTDSDMALTTLQTSAGQIIGTLQYMSPEQCSADPRALDHRSDVYSLGIILYELVCEKLPYDVGSASLGEATRIIRESPTPRPSTINKTVRGDLETILLRAVDKDRDRRYQSVADLKDDIDRYLASQPIRARRDGLGYLLVSHARGMARRNRALAVVSIIAGGSLIGGLSGPPLLSATGLDRVFQTACASLAAPAQPKSFSFVRVIAITPETPVKDLADKLGLTAVDPANWTSVRLLHGKLLERLATLGPRVVGFDIMFRNPAAIPGSPAYIQGTDPAEPIPFDDGIVAGIGALRKRGIPAVFCYPGHTMTPSGEPPLSRAIATIAARGSAAGCASQNALWSLPAAIEHPGDPEARYALSLAVLGAWMQPDALRFTVRMDPARGFIHLNYWNPAGLERRAVGTPTDVRLNIGTWAPSTPKDERQNAQVGVMRGDVVAGFPIDPPTAQACRDATIEFSRAFEDDPSLRATLAGKVVLIANLRDSGDVLTHPSGLRVPGPYVQAAAIESLLAGRVAMAPSTTEHWLMVLVAAMAGVGMTAAGPSRRWLGWVMFGAVGVLGVGAGLVAYRWAHILYNPGPALLAMIIAAGFAGMLPPSGARTAP